MTVRGALLVCVAVGCASTVTDDPAASDTVDVVVPVDNGGALDVDGVDIVAPDAGPPPTDASVEDVAAEDVAVPDAGPDDIGPVDVPDAVVADAGQPDAAQPDVVDPPPKPWAPAGPLDTEPPPFAAQPHTLSPTPLWGALEAPYPTNAWWQNVVLGGGGNPINALPYLLKVLSTGLTMSHGAPVIQPTVVYNAFVANLRLGAVTDLTGHSVVAHDALSVTVTWSAAEGTMTAPLVRGMPYVTMVYSNVTPVVATGHAILAVNGQGGPAEVSGDKFTIELNNGQVWAVYANPPITLSTSISSAAASAPFTGTLRAALLTGDAAYEAALDAHKKRIPLGGAVALGTVGDEGTIELQWQAQGDGDLLMMTLPHHRDMMPAPSQPAVKLGTLKGLMVGTTGDWTLTLPLADIAWDAPAGIDPQHLEAIEAALPADADWKPDSWDPYFFGKDVARLGRVALIADEVGDAASAAKARETIKATLTPWLDGSGGKLAYDSTWGGVCSTSGMADAGADFGNGWYNDHHFHWGYHIYAAAAVAKADPDWLAAHHHQVLALIRDIANPTADDPHFTPFRHMDWFVGHSWAAGLFAFGDSRNQESTSEAVNAYYAVHLYGLAADDPDIANLGRLMCAAEIASAQKYWQIDSGDGIYPEPFASNKVVGVLWSTKVDYATFFGNEAHKIHGIQLLPFTPISEALLEPGWVTEQYPVVSQDLGSPLLAEGWKGFIYMEHAVVDAAAAWEEAQTLKAFDDGNTLTNTLYWIATRP